MTKIVVKFEKSTIHNTVERINGLVCTGGSLLSIIPGSRARLVFPGRRTMLTAKEASTFVRNMLDEGFEETIILS